MTEEVINKEINKEESITGVTMDKISRIPVDLTIEVGRAKLTLQEIIALKEGDVIALNKLSSDPFDIKVNGHKVAEGEIVQHENQFYVKVSHILDKAE